MKKVLTTLFSIILSFTLTLSVNAEEKKPIGNGYTTEGVYYVVYDIETAQNIQRSTGTLTLLTFSVSGQNTIAYYKGTLTAIN